MGCPFASLPKLSANEEFDRIREYYPLLATTSCTTDFCQSGRMVHTIEPRVGVDKSIEEIELEATDLLTQLRRDGIVATDEALQGRLTRVKSEIRTSAKVVRSANGQQPKLVGGTWAQTFEELEHGVRLAWKHSKRCIMRSEHLSLRVIDLRDIKTSKEMGQALVQAMRQAFNRGDIVTSAFVFPQRQPSESGPMIWNNNSLNYAGYIQQDGSVLGEPVNVNMTDEFIKLGWKPPAIRSSWDLLPIVTMAQDDSPHITELSKDDFPDVIIGHPDAQHNLAFRKRGLRWGCSPVLSRLGFDIGGVQYTAVPFLGYFADMEIGVRNLADKTGYNALPSVVEALNLLPEGQSLDDLPPYEQLAKLQTAQTELTRAVYWSYTQAGVRIIDTLSASNMYCEFDDLHLAEKGFRLPADPYWLAPPQGSIIPLWHRGGAPNYQPRPLICRHREDPIKTWERRKLGWKQTAPGLLPTQPATNDLTKLLSAVSITPSKLDTCDSGISLSTVPSLRIHYCGSGSTAKRLAQKLEHRLQALLANYDTHHYQFAGTSPLSSLDLETTNDTDLILIVASSSGRGDIPTNGLTFFRQLDQRTSSQLSTARFALFGNGNSTYGPVDYNAAASKLEKALVSNGMKQVIPLYQGDVSKEDPPLEQFDEWWQSLLRILTAEDMLGPAPENHEPVQEAKQDAVHEIEIPKMIRAKLLSVEGTGMKRVTLDIGAAEYTGMSHVDTYIPIKADMVKLVLNCLGLRGDEPLETSGRAITAEDFLTITDLNKPFLHTNWVADSGLADHTLLRTLTVRSMLSTIETWLHQPIRSDNLHTLLSSIPLLVPRVFSAASSIITPSHASFSGNTLSLIVQPRPLGHFTETFLADAKPGDELCLSIHPGPAAHLISDPRPLIVFTQGSGIAPLRSLLQARLALHQQGHKGLGGIVLFLTYRAVDKELVEDAVGPAEEAGLLDTVLRGISNEGKRRVQDTMLLEDDIRKLVVKRVGQDEARVFVCAGREAAADFVVNVEAVTGIERVKDVLGERWVEEVYVRTGHRS